VNRLVGAALLFALACAKPEPIKVGPKRLDPKPFPPDLSFRKTESIKSAPGPVIRIPGLFAYASLSGGSWFIHLQIDEKTNTRGWIVKAEEEGLNITMKTQSGQSSATWTTSRARFSQRKPFFLRLQNEGVDASIRVDIPPAAPNDDGAPAPTTMGLTVRVLR
jgi:hypothetical protein